MLITIMMMMVMIMMSEKRYIDDVELLEEHDRPCAVLLHRSEEKMWAIRLMMHS